MTKCLDFHCHSTASDGELSPEALVARAAEQGVEVLALTDHDTVAGIPAARAAAAQAGMQLLPAIECSAQWRKRSIHVVGLGIDMHDPGLIAALAELEQLRQARGVSIAEKLEKLGVVDALAGAQRYAQGAPLGRPHFAAHMVASGFVKDSAQAFKRYLGTGKAGDVGNVWPELADVVASITCAGGVAVLAHPDKYKLTRTKLYELTRDFAAAGGQGLEVVSGRQDAAVTAKLSRLCGDFNLWASTGSDFHRPGQPWQELGQQSALPADCAAIWDLLDKR